MNESSARNSLATAVSDVYAAFAHLPRPRTLEMSPMKDARTFAIVLSDKELCNLTANEIGSFADSALYTVGNLNDYKYFLPRILDLAVLQPDDAVGYVGLEAWAIASKLVYGKWTSWPPREQEAVLNLFQMAFAATARAVPKVSDNAASWVVGLATLEQRISDHLAIWKKGDPSNCLLCFAQSLVTIADWLEALETDPETSLLRNLHDGQIENLSQWICEPSTMEILEDALRTVPREQVWQVEYAIEHVWEAQKS